MHERYGNIFIRIFDGRVFEDVVLIVLQGGVLERGCSFEVFAGVGVETEGFGGGDDGVEGFGEGEGGGEEGFFVALAGGALGEEGVVVGGAVDVVVGC